MEPTKVLVVDDDDAIVTMIGARLARIGISIVPADHARQGLARMQEHHFPVVITDLYMPGMQGEELICTLKREYPFTQIIVITGETTTERIRRCLTLGVTDFFFKTEDLSSLDTSVSQALCRSVRWQHHVNADNTFRKAACSNCTPLQIVAD
ncbi:MAG TPA: response regulator [Planctomycetes bacterium]|nr:response regulator [Planctomycetota bacterium]